MQVTSAIILAGGNGERLMPITAVRPKPMVDIAGELMLVRIIKWVSRYGIKKIVLAVGNNHKVFQQEIGDGSQYGVEVAYSIENQPLSTGGAVKLASKHPLLKKEKNIMVLNGDTICNTPLNKMFDLHTKNKADFTVLAIKRSLPWDILRIGKNSKLLAYQGRPKIPYWFNSGVYVYSRALFKYLPKVGEQEPTILPLCKKFKFMTYKSSAFFRAVDTLKDKREAETYLLSKGKTDRISLVNA